jgi:glucose/mannose-6-phosphate isomerase
LDISTIKKIDSKKMYETYDLWPEIAKNAYENKFEKLDIKNIDHVVFVGNGGSGSIGDTISSILSKENMHVTIVKGYLLPKTVDSNTLVIATSVSGNTIEALSVLKNLKGTSTKVICFSSGGLMEKYCNNNNIRFQKISKIHSPRASFTSFLYSILNVLEPILPIQHNDVNESISVLEKTRKNIFSENLNKKNKALELSKFIKGIICIYYPAGLQAAAIRYKNSLQENTKIHAMTEDVIESCHNGIVSWEKKSDVKPILIQGKNDHIKTRERFSILKEYFDNKNIDYRIVESVNGSILTKIINLSYLLDYSSIYASILNKTDPTPVKSIEEVKKKL